MFTCKDCVHYDLCKYNHFQDAQRIRANQTILISIARNKPCKFFKDKADFVEVRCKDCICYEPYNKPAKDFDGYCIARACETDETGFCNYGEKKEGINNG